jgi:hypothetical protein
MKKSLLVVGFGLICLLQFSNMYGQRFFETETVEEADFTVFFVFETSQSDLKVFFVYNETEAVKPGMWMEVPTAEEADIKIIFVDVESEADMKISMDDAASDAGWVTTGKEDLLKFKGQ